jgi:hypothetical protein
VQQESYRATQLSTIGVLLAFVGTGLGVWAAFLTSSPIIGSLRVRILTFQSVPFLLVIALAIVAGVRRPRSALPAGMLLGVGSWSLIVIALRYLAFIGYGSPGWRGIPDIAAPILVLASGSCFLLAARSDDTGWQAMPAAPVSDAPSPPAPAG